MKFFPFVFLCLFISWSSFGFFPAESVSENHIVSESAKSKSVSTTTPASKFLEKLESKEAKAKMTFKERMATKLLKKKIKKAEEKLGSKNIESSKDGGALAAVFRIIGAVLIILGVVGLFTSVVTAGIGAIIVGIILFLLPSLI